MPKENISVKTEMDIGHYCGDCLNGFRFIG